MGSIIKITDNSETVLSEFKKNIAAANEAVGLAMEGHVKESAPVGTPESTGIKNYHGDNMRKSITHKVIDDTVYVGTNMSVTHNGQKHPYPLYVELGTGIHADGGKGRKSPWVWRDKNGKYHYTHGIKPTHFMRNALSSPEHIAEYKDIYEKQLEKG